jgi:tricorn protease
MVSRGHAFMNALTRSIGFAASLASAIVVVGCLAGPAQAQTKLLRFPDIHGDHVAFCYAGDLWRAPADGGAASQITTHRGQELFPKYSPDGRWIAFTGQYDGDEQVYVVPAAGGEPRQLTYYPARGPLPPRGGYDNQVCGWTPDGKSVLFRSMRDADGAGVETALYTVSVDGEGGGLPKKLPMPNAGAGDISPDGKRVLYSPLFRDFRSWKRYEGGWAQELYVFDLASNRVQPVAPSKRTERDPMWVGDEMYFVSDRDDTLNLYSYDADNDRVAQHTHEKTWDVRWASSDGKRRIVYELDGELVVYDTQAKRSRPISIDVPSDGTARRPSHYAVDKYVEDFGLSPAGERALFTARGDVFTAPIEHGVTRNLTNSSDAHDRAAVWSPDGRQIAFISDRSGEDEIYLVEQDGLDEEGGPGLRGEPRQLTDGLKSMLFSLRWSPDGKRLAFSDKYGKLHVLTIAGKKLVEAADEKHGLLRDFAWSPCGQHLAIVLSESSEYRSIHLWSVADEKLRRATPEWADSSDPTWDPAGDYLYFASRRQFAPQISSVEWNFAGNRDQGVFALALRKDVKHPFPPQSDEVKIAGAEKKDDVTKDDDKKDTAKKDDPTAEPAKKPKKKKKKAAAKREAEQAAKSEAGAKTEKKTDEKPATKIDFEGLVERAIRVPIDADNIAGLTAAGKYLVYTVYSAPFYGREPEKKPRLQIFDPATRKATTLAEEAGSFQVSADGSKVLVRNGSAFELWDVKPEGSKKKSVSTKGLAVDRTPSEEWAEVFEETWRRFRDFFYVRNMHGYDWEAIGKRYRDQLKYVGHRSDLNYVIAEMIAELNAGHCYVAGGDYETPDRPTVGLPGARFELDEKAGRYRIAKIFPGDNQEEKYRSPLTEVGVDVREGDYVLAIDGTELKGNDNPYRLLRNKSQIVTLTVNGKPQLKGAREVRYRPVTSEANLLYLDWVTTNRAKVAEATDGRVGYLHVPDMGADGIYEFIKWYYPQIRKEGLIIDVRSNGGGNVSQWLIERLDNKLLGTWFGSLDDEPGTYPHTVFHGHMTCLINQVSASDGDIFPYRFRQAGLGRLIGKRTWGGVVGITNLGPLIDGGEIYVPLSATSSPTGEYIIEGHGVDPDIEVENPPDAVIAGRDPQLERGIREVMEKIKADPKKLPKRPADPVKTPKK